MSKSIQVGIRAKPTSSSIHVWDIDPKESLISLASNGAEFRFNRVFSPETQTYEIYQEMADDVVQGFMEGYNGTIFAYGSTGSGKTFTMMGDNDHPGVTPLAVSHIFEHIQQDTSREYVVGLSYFEIYNETIKDLLRPNSERSKNIKFSQQLATSYEDVMRSIQGAEENRATGSTSMNEHSSRSHAIIRIALESKSATNSNGSTLRSVLNLIDLAGSECQKDTNAEGSRQREASNINRSLLALSNIISALQNGKQVVSYRDSKLTLYLQNSLGGNAQTVIICTINQENNQQSTTKSTLQFAIKAMKIKNNVKANEIKSDKTIIEEQKQEIIRLQAEVDRLKSLLNSNEDIPNKLPDENIYLTPKQKDSSTIFDLSYSSSPVRNENIDANKNETNSSFYVTEEIPCLPKKKKKTFTFLKSKLNVNNFSSTSPKTPEKELNPVDFTHTMSPIDYDPSPICLPKKKRIIQPDDITEEEKMSDEEADRQANELSRAILERNPALLKNSSLSLMGSENQIPIDKNELEMLKQEKEQLSNRVSELEKIIPEKEQLANRISELERMIPEREQLSNRVLELENLIQEKDKSFNIFNQTIKHQEDEITRLNEAMSNSKDVESLQQNVEENQNIIKNQSAQINQLKEEIEKMKSSLLLKDAQIKGAALNTTQLQSRIKQKDSFMAHYSEEVEENKKSMAKQIDSQNRQIESLTQQINALKSQNIELSNQNQDFSRKHEEAIKLKNEELIRKCNQFCKKLEETGKKCDTLSKKNKELEEEKRQLEKKYNMSLISRNPSSFIPNAPTKAELKYADKDSNLTEVSMGNDTLAFSIIEQSVNQPKPIAPTYNNISRRPLQQKDSNNLNALSSQILMQKSLIEKFQKVNPNFLNESSKFFNNNVNPQQSSVSSARHPKRNKLGIEESTFFEYVNQTDEVYSFQRDTSFSTREIQDDKCQIKKPMFNVNEATEVLFDASSSDFDDENSTIVASNKNDILNEKQKSKQDDSILSEKEQDNNNNQEINEEEDDDDDHDINQSNDSISVDNVEFNSLHNYENFETENIETFDSSNSVSDFLNLLTLLINLFLWISLFLI